MKTEKLIKEEVEKYKVFFQDIIDGNISKVKCRDTKNPQPMEYGFIEEKYGIKWTNIPDKLRDFLVGRTLFGFNKKAAKVISEMIASNRHSINRFNDKIQKISGKDNKMGKKRPGQLASYLMKDIIALQPTALHGTLKGTDKLTGLNYSILQANLSTYNAIYNKNEFDKLKSMFTNAKLIGTSNNQHPFLDKIFKDRPENTIKFYQSYMKHRLVWLNQILEKKNFEDVNILKPDRMKWAKKNSEYYKNLAKRYLSQPIELPRCLFENSIIDIMIEICSKNDKLQEFKEQLIKYRNKEKGVRFNTTYLIMKYHEFPVSFNWAEMDNNKANDANAQYLLNVGRMIGLIYEVGDSGADTGEVLAALHKFGYTDAIKCEHDETKVLSELLANRPVYMRGRDGILFNAKGHAWVCDGVIFVSQTKQIKLMTLEDCPSNITPVRFTNFYNQENYISSARYHMNWGFYGICDAFYYDDNIKIQLGDEDRNYNRGREEIIHIYPINN